MPDIQIEREHSFDFATARGYAKEWLQKANEEFGLSVDYQEGEGQDVATIKKAGVDARAILTADKVRFEAELAFLAKPLKGTIVSGIEKGLDDFFSKNKSA